MSAFGAAIAIVMAIWPGAAKEQRHDAAPAQARKIGVAYARCAVKRDRDAVVDYLDVPFGADYPDKLAKALPSICLNEAIGHTPTGPSSLRFSPILTRGLLFEALYRQDFGRRPVAPEFDRVPQRSYPIAGVDKAGQSSRRDYQALMRIGDCSARAAPAGVQALLATDAASDDEQRAIADLHDAWLACLPGHRELPFSAEMVRATVAEPFYRLVRAQFVSLDR